jgi:hypothetical protein
MDNVETHVALGNRTKVNRKRSLKKMSNMDPYNNQG